MNRLVHLVVCGLLLMAVGCSAPSGAGGGNANGASDADGGKQQVLFFEEQDGAWTAIDLVEPQHNDFVLDSYGNAMALKNGTLVIGARSDDAGGQRAAGAAYVYTEGDDSGPDIPDGVRF